MVSSPSEPNLIEQTLGKFEFSHLVDKVLLQTMRQEIRQGKLQLDKKIGKDLEDGNYELGKIEAFREGCYRLPVTLNSSGKTVQSFCKLGRGKKALEELATGAEVATFLGKEKKLKFVPRVLYYNPNAQSPLPQSWGIFSRGINALLSRKEESTTFYATEFLGGEYRPFNRDMSHLEKKSDRKKLIALRLIENIVKYHKTELTPALQHKLSNNRFAKRGFRAIEYLRKVNPEAYDGSSLSKLWDSVELALRGQEIGLIHNDLHGGNIYSNPDGELKIIDWDDATIGLPQTDLCRALMGLGYCTEEKREEERSLVEALYKRLEKPGKWEDFVKAHDLTHLSIRLRLAAGNANRIKESSKVIQNEQYREEYIQALEKLTNYHLTVANRLMREYNLTELSSGIKDFFSQTSLSAKDEKWVRQYTKESEGNPDCYAVSKLETILKKDSEDQTPELSESVKEQVEEERQVNTLTKHIAAGARKRKRKWWGLAGAMAAVVAGTVLIGGSLAYNKYVKPVQEKLAEEQSVVESLAKEWQPDFTEEVFLEREMKIIKKDENRENYAYQDEKHLLVPVIVSYAHLQDRLPQLQAEWERYLAGSKLPPKERDLEACYSRKEPFSFCFSTKTVDEKDFTAQKNKIEEERAIEISQKNFSQRSSLKQLFSAQDYYSNASLEKLLDELSRAYFTLPGIMEALSEVKGEKFPQFLEAKTANRYSGKDPRFRAHILTSQLASAIKESRSLAGGYVRLLCSPEEISLQDGNEEEVFFSVSPCADEAKEAYFNFLVRNGITPELLEKFAGLKMETERKNLLLAKMLSPISDEGLDATLYLLGGLEKGYIQLVKSGLDLTKIVIEHWEKSNQYPGSECEYRWDNLIGKLIKEDPAVLTFSYESESIRLTLSALYKEVYPLVQKRKMATEQASMNEALHSSWRSVFLTRSLPDELYQSFVNVYAITRTGRLVSALPLNEEEAIKFLVYEGGVDKLALRMEEYVSGLVKVYGICQKEGVFSNESYEFTSGIAQMYSAGSSIREYLPLLIDLFSVPESDLLKPEPPKK